MSNLTREQWLDAYGPEPAHRGDSNNNTGSRSSRNGSNITRSSNSRRDDNEGSGTGTGHQRRNQLSIIHDRINEGQSSSRNRTQEADSETATTTRSSSSRAMPSATSRLDNIDKHRRIQNYITSQERHAQHPSSTESIITGYPQQAGPAFMTMPLPLSMYNLISYPTHEHLQRQNSFGSTGSGQVRNMQQHVSMQSQYFQQLGQHLQNLQLQQQHGGHVQSMVSPSVSPVRSSPNVQWPTQPSFDQMQDQSVSNGNGNSTQLPPLPNRTPGYHPMENFFWDRDGDKVYYYWDDIHHKFTVCPGGVGVCNMGCTVRDPKTVLTIWRGVGGA
ncbi:hypothetical protein HDU76_003159, partial [Blyttiomyces sp. JEL0837]